MLDDDAFPSADIEYDGYFEAHGIITRGLPDGADLEVSIYWKPYPEWDWGDNDGDASSACDWEFPSNFSHDLDIDREDVEFLL